MNSLQKIFGVIFLLACMIFNGGKVSAAGADAMEIFRETVYETAGRDDRIFRQMVHFVLPNFTSELNFISGVSGGKFNVAGDFGLWMAQDSGEFTELAVPFYLAQNGDDIVIYFQSPDDGKWKKMTAPVSASQIADAISTSSAQEILQKIDLVKEVDVLRDTDSQRILRVQIDGDKLADRFRRANKVQNAFAQYIDTGIRGADIWYTWTVNKNTWQTVGVSANFSGVVQSIAQAALNDTANPLPEPIRDILENVAFYSEFKAYTTYLNPEAKSRLEIPKKVLKSKEVESFTADSGKKK